MKKTAFAFSYGLALVFLTACPEPPAQDAGVDDAHLADAGPADAGQGALAIIGNYVDDWNFDHNVTAAAWTDPGDPSDSIFHISQYSNAGYFIIAQNDPANPYTVANQWSRFDWTYDSNSLLHFCQITFSAATEAAALADNSANRSNLATGCGGFGWSPLHVALAIRGSYVDEWDLAHVVTQTAWTDPGDPSDSVFHISQFSNPGQYIIAQNDPANPYTVANQWSRFDWTYDTSSLLHFCQITYAAATEAAALGTTSANRSDLGAGCNGFGWSSLTPQ